MSTDFDDIQEEVRTADLVILLQSFHVILHRQDLRSCAGSDQRTQRLVLLRDALKLLRVLSNQQVTNDPRENNAAPFVDVCSVTGSQVVLVCGS